MIDRSVAGAIALAAVLTMAAGSARAADESKYPDWKGQWTLQGSSSAGSPARGRTTRPGPADMDNRRRSPPNIRRSWTQASRIRPGAGSAISRPPSVFPAGMPHMMMAFGPQEYVITPETTYILINWDDHNRRIFTDGRDWPARIEPTFSGCSIGRWIDEDGDGRFDVLEVETRGPFKGPRAYDATGLPLHFDNQSVFKERIHLDKADRNVLHDEITVIDHALTRPWTVDKRYTRNSDPHPSWPEYYCGENNAQVTLGAEHYFLGGDGNLRYPPRKDQPPPDLKYFGRTQK